MYDILQGNIATRFRSAGSSDYDFITNLLLLKIGQHLAKLPVRKLTAKRRVHRGTLLLKDEELTSDLTYSKQELL